MKRLIRAAALLLALLLPLCADADIAWPAFTTNGQKALKDYIESVNANLLSLGRAPVNSLFELYPFAATLGVTGNDMAEVPEGVEMSFDLYTETLNILTLRMSDLSAFPDVAASCIQAAAPDAIDLSGAMREPSAYVKKARKAPETSSRDTVDPMNGDQVRTYYAYEPNPYHDGVNWIVMTLVFPIGGEAEAGVAVTPVPENPGHNREYEGYFQPPDEASHFEVFVTNTPEPDSPAGGWDIPSP